MNKNAAVPLDCTNSYCKGEVVVHVQQKFPIILSICLSLSHSTLDIFAIGKYINHRNEHRLEIPTNLQSLDFHGPEKAIKLAKK